MPEPNLFEIFVCPLNDLGIRYMVTGAVASIVYGEPRLTHDIDLIVELTDESLPRIQKVFPQEEFYCPPADIIKIEKRRPLRGHFNVIHHETGFKADMYMIGQDRLHHWAMSRRKRIQTSGGSFWVAPPEYVILRKLEYYRERKSDKHLRDITSMMEISFQQIDLRELESKIEERSLTREWKEARDLISRGRLPKTHDTPDPP